MMKFCFFLGLLMLSATPSQGSELPRLGKYSNPQEWFDLLKKNNGTEWKIPEGFSGGYTTPWSHYWFRQGGLQRNDNDNGPRWGNFFSAAFLSEDKSCLLCYSQPFWRKPASKDFSSSTMVRLCMERDILDARIVGAISDNNGKSKLTCDTLCGKDVPFGADTVFALVLPLKEPYLEVFSYCYSYYVFKNGCQPMLFRIFLNEEGMKQAGHYRDVLYESARYTKRNRSIRKVSRWKSIIALTEWMEWEHRLFLNQENKQHFRSFPDLASCDVDDK